MRLVFHVATGFVILVALGAAWATAFGSVRVAPVPLVVTALYLGLTSRGHLASAVASAIFLGYCADVLVGAPGGLFALSAALTVIFAHIAQGRFVLRGLLAGALVSAIAAACFLLLAAALSRAVGLHIGSELSPLVLGGSAALTAFVGPLQLGVHRRVDGRLARTQRERDATLEGVASA